MESKKSLNGEFKISEDVVKKIAGLSAIEVKGVASLSENKKSAGILSTSPVSVKNLGGVIEVTVKIIVNNNVNVSRVSVNVQNSVKDSVQSMTGIPVSKVNVVVDGVEFDD